VPGWWWFSTYAQCGAIVATSKKLFYQSHILAASEITATEESQKFLHRSEGVSAPHRNHCGRGESEGVSVPLRKERTSSIGRS
jgi:hypothetical protein